MCDHMHYVVHPSLPRYVSHTRLCNICSSQETNSNPIIHLEMMIQGFTEPKII
uniref:Uncharacterized protein n=1 Tax=Rhizophora mucronata TaxID=61149 RepID=A0A2P2N5M7_RHIMU